MPVLEKINNIIHRKKSVPEAPVASAAPVTHTVLPVEPITNDTLLHQKEVLHETEALEETGLARETLVQEERFTTPIMTHEPALLREEVLSQEIYGDKRGSLQLRQEPIILERVEKEVVVHERIHPVEKEETQPIIYREREQLDVKQITQLMHETQVQPTVIEQRELPAETREAVIERAAPLPSNIVLPTREVNTTLVSREMKAPIVEEVIKRTVIEEVQPVLERDIIAPVVVQHTQPIYEKIIEAPTVTREIRGHTELGTRGLALGNETVYNAGGHNLSSGQYSTSGAMYGDNIAYNSTLQQGNLSNSSYEQRLLEQQIIRDDALLLEQQRLPTGQVLPQVASTRPAYSYLPSGYAERRPDFVGTGSEYVMQAKNIPLTHNRGMHVQSTYPQVPPTVLRQ